ncbi:MAG: radical SAM protein [Planctomycetota bacterium]
MPPTRNSPDETQPVIAVVFLQPDCNMSCTFCVTEDTIDTMAFAQAVALLGELAARGIAHVVLGGGEPFTWPGDVVHLAEVAHARGFHVQVGTNGVALPAGFEHLAAIDRFVVPLESMHAATHDAMRRFQARHHALILERLRALKAAAKSITVSTVVTARNVNDVVLVGEFLRDQHAGSHTCDAWHLYRFLPLGRGGGARARAARDRRGVCAHAARRARARPAVPRARAARHVRLARSAVLLVRGRPAAHARWQLARASRRPHVSGQLGLTRRSTRRNRSSTACG